MAMENRNLETGTVLRARYKGKERTCEVVHTPEGLRYRLDDGTEHKSPSSAGKAVTGGACNGWVFWSVAGKATAKKAKAKKAPAAKKPVKPKADAKKIAKGKAAKPKKGKEARVAARSDRRVAKETASYGCGVCGATFPTMKAATEHAAEAHLG